MAQLFGIAENNFTDSGVNHASALGLQDVARSSTAALEDATVRLTQTLRNDPLVPVIAAMCLAGIIYFAIKYFRSYRGDRAGVQRILDSLPDAVAIFDPNGKLLALNRKLSELMPLKLEPSVYGRTSTTDLYSQISPDNAAIERARKHAREAAPDLD